MKALEIKDDEYCLCDVSPRHVGSDADFSQVQIPL